MTHQHGHLRSAGSCRRSVRGLAAGGAALAAAALAVAPLSGAAAAPRPAATAASGTTVWGWGPNLAGELGRARPAVAKTPIRASLPRGTRITSVRAGCFATLALTSTGKVLGWGDDSLGQLGNGVTGPGGPRVVQARIPAGMKITAVRAGCHVSLALTSTGQVLAWGDDALGSLGNGSDKPSNIPVLVQLPPDTKVKAISAGLAHGLALTTDGKVLAWGDNNQGQLGDGTNMPADVPVPVKLPPGTKVTAIAAGNDHSTAITGTGKVLTWGENGSGQLGDGSTLFSNVPVRASLPPETRVRGLFAGCADTVALTAAGKVLAWGDNSRGQLGINSTKNSSRPVTARLPAGSRVTAISAGCQHVLARTASGRVLAWGDNGSGQIGDGAGERFRRLPVRVRLPAGVKVSAVASGPLATFSLAIG